MSKKARNDDRLTFGAPPRADLLPQELKEAARARAQRRGLIGLVVFTIVIVGAAYAYVFISAATSVQRLDSANGRTESLRTEQGKFIEVRVLATQVATAEAAQVIGVSTEIDWKAYLVLVQGSLPSGTTIDSVSASTAAPGVIANLPTGPLRPTSIAELQFAATTATLPNVSEWIDNLSELPGFADAVPGSISLNDDGTYSVSIVMHINDQALSHRFATDATDATGAAGTTNTDTTDAEAGK